MAKSSPEKLAQALRANLKRRKQPKAVQGDKPSAEPAPKAPPKPPKSGA